MSIARLNRMSSLVRSTRAFASPTVRRASVPGPRAALRRTVELASSRPTTGTASKSSTMLPGLPAPAAGSAGVRISPWVAGGLLGAVAYGSGDKDLSELGKKHSFKRNVELGGLVSTGIKMHEELLAPTHERVAKDPARKLTSEALQQEGRVVRWLDASGVIELGAHGTQKFPVALLANGDAGFDGKAVLEYRVLTPFSARVGEDMSVELMGGSLVVPTTPEALRNMPAGSEFELSGRGNVKVRGDIRSERGAGASILSFLANGGAHAEGKASANLKIHMKVLDNEGRVEVVLKENTQQEAGFAAFLKTTLGLDDAAIAEIGNGELEKAIVKEGKTKVAKWWKQYKDSQVRYDRSYQSSYDKVATFKIDTSTADGALAYSALLGLDITKAQEMSVRDGSGVTMRDVRSGATTDSGALDLNLMGHRVLLHKALYAERSGDVRVDGELIRMFRDSEVAHTSGNFLGGYETVKWGAVSVMKGSGEDTTTFYNLNYAGDDWITRETEIDRFFGFADALGVENAQARKRESSGMWWIERVFSARDNTKVKVDMYFTQEGVRRISESSYEDAQYAVLKACASLNPQVAGIESLTVDEFSSAIDYAYDLRALQDDPDVGPFASSSCLAARKYEQLTGRNLLLDADAIETAATFLAHKSSLGEGASDQDRRSFFTELGQEQRFRYKPAMVALVNLAGRDNALVGELSMVGEETELVARSEGTIERPSTPV